MPAMKSVRTAAPGTIQVVEIQRPAPGPRDVLVRVRACGICGTDAAFVQMGGMPLGPDGQTTAIPLGHEPAGEVVEVGAEVTGLKTGDRVVVNPQAAPSGIIGCGGTLGGMSEYLLIQNAHAGQSVAVFPDDLPSRSPRSTSRWPSPGTASTARRPGPRTRSWSSAPGPSGSGR
jgi:(R,R)-butanediol dehydrogenase/meso-butanediol dehydrogenase/diacetyl reductase